MKFKRLYADARAPTRGSKEAAGWDLYAHLPHEKAVIHPYGTMVIGTGVAFQCPEGHFGAIYARSGLASKKGVRPRNCVGVLDADFRGEVLVYLYNDDDLAHEIKDGDRIAQIVFQPYNKEEMEEVDELDATERGEGGFGSTGR